MIRVFAWIAVLLVLCLGLAWAVMTPFPFHLLAAAGIMVAMFVAMLFLITAFAHVVNNSGGL